MKQVIGGMFLAGAVALFCYAVYNTAWLSDDAYISYRSVDNLAHGYGLTWNTTERVQAFTNPLWVLLNVPAYLAAKAPWQIYFSGLLTSAVVALLGVLVLGLGVARSSAVAVFAIVALSFSRAYVDYSTSGLENPMTHLLLALFVLYAVRQRWSPGTIFSMSLCAGLSLVNRMDTALIFAPVLAYAWLAERNLRTTLVILAGFAPFIAWEIFSVVYYGFPFPNTAYAKLGTGIDKLDTLREGWHYFVNSWNTDPLTLVLIALGLVGAPLALRQGKYTALALGGVLYVAYLVNVGGDFMQGRLLTPVLMVAVLLIARMRGGALAWGLAALIAVGISYRAPDVPIHQGVAKGELFDENRICDEAEFWARSTGLKYWRDGKQFPAHNYADTGRKIAAQNAYVANTFQSIGFRGYFSGPKSIITDQYALSDPLLARIPAYYNPKWRIGHFTRHAPKWYTDRKKALAASLQERAGDGPALTWQQALAVVPVKEDVAVVAPTPQTGRVDVDNDPNLQTYYDRLELIVRGPLWSKARWEAIVNMNLGRYDALIANDAYRFPRMLLRKASDLATVREVGADWDAKGNVVLPKAGLEIQLEKVVHNAFVEISADHNDDYTVLFVNGGQVVGEAYIAPVKGISGLNVTQLVTPNQAIRAGYDALRIFGYGGDGKSSVGHLRFP